MAIPGQPEAATGDPIASLQCCGIPLPVGSITGAQIIIPWRHTLKNRPESKPSAENHRNDRAGLELQPFSPTGCLNWPDSIAIR